MLPSVLWHCWLGGRKGIRPVKNGGWWRWALVSPDGVAPSRIVCVSASVNLPLHHKVPKFSSGTGSPGWSRKKGRKTVVVIASESLCRGTSEMQLWMKKGWGQATSWCQCFVVPPVLWHRWLGDRKGIQPPPTKKPRQLCPKILFWKR